jgi:hypothetical protein
MEFSGLDIPGIGPLPKGSAGLSDDEIFGLKDPMVDKNFPKN